ncbi:MAG TPA: oligosaccharide flippase family protein [Opitutus sp.]|nr:oligosaccharide flippase family protein [Opitutus sp.]
MKPTPPTPAALRFWQDNAPLKSSAVTLSFQVVRYVANIGLTMALARLIAPADFGLFAMAVTFTGLLMLFRDGGLEAAMISRGHASEHERAAVTGLACFYGLLLAAACAAAGPVLARVFGEPRLVAALLLPAGAFLFYGLDVMPSADLLLAHRFRTHAAVEMVAIFTGWCATLLLAWRGAGYWALFSTEIVSAASLLAGHAWAARWRPRFSRSWGLARHFFHFGRTVSFNRALGHASRNIDNLILGVVAGATGLAFYSKAYRLVSVPQDSINSPLTRMALPLLARLRDTPAEFVRAYRHFILTSLALSLPGVAFLLLSTPQIVAIIYGPTWTPVVPLLRLLGLMGLFGPLLVSAGWVFTALGTVDRQLRWEVLNVVVLTAAFLVGAHWGVAGVAAAASLGHTALRVPALLYCFRGSPLRLRDVAEVVWRPLLATAIAAGFVLLVQHTTAPGHSVLAAVARDGVVLAAGYALGWIAVPGWRAFLRHELRRPAASATTPASDRTSLSAAGTH